LYAFSFEPPTRPDSASLSPCIIFSCTACVCHGFPAKGGSRFCTITCDSQISIVQTYIIFFSNQLLDLFCI
jgi:hypothetical protein